MKKCFYMLAMALCINIAAKAAPGDTTWVQANITNLDNYGNYDSTIHFPAPGTTYRKIYMIFTLGKHTCPGYTYGTGSVPWCADWDYTVLNYLMTPGGDTMEMGRFITPYANAGNTSLRFPYSWTGSYVYDVTDYASKLQNTATMRILYSGYSGGFTANIKFAFIEGTPERNVISIKKLWGGSFGYGGTPDINTNFATVSETAPSGTVTSDLKFLVTGHGSDASGCCEFAPHNYQVMLNGSSVANTTIWRDNCGSNEYYPQTGTWIYQRGNWCPGAMVYPNFHELPGITAGSAYNIGLQFDSYTGSGGSYTTDATLVNYGAMNKTVDASLDGINSPIADENHYRENPALNSSIHIRNTGSTTITSMQIQYYIDGSSPTSYNWTGSLASRQEIDLTLPQLPAQPIYAGTTGTHSYTARIQEVNGATDGDATNNQMSSTFLSAPLWPTTFKVVFRTNNEADDAGNCETFWQITDLNDNVVKQHMNAATDVTFTDTVTLPAGSYKFKVFDTLNRDGLSFWNFPAGTTDGSIAVKKMAGTTIPITGNYAGDFGSGFVQYFSTDAAAAVENISAIDMAIQAYPNPAHNEVNVEISGLQQVNGTIQLIDALGRVVSMKKCNSANQQINVAGFASGVYTVLFLNEASGNKLQTRLIIAK